ncbi:MAG: hypothetical protein MUF14_00835 [Hyphomonadaceae bacterium]|nr:hypothetical protein [Hyphomonadaceae bacterium]
MPANARIIDVTATPAKRNAGPVSGLFFPFPAPAKPSARQPASRKPLSARMIGFVLQHADLETDLGDGRVALSFSQALLASDRMRARLGFAINKIRRARVIWSPATGSVVGYQA